uniref:Uncharacterized protein yeaE n=1 Tax=Lygus hesperus TaxID=30085 RepID=A0A0A9XPN0_LYGHE
MITHSLPLMAYCPLAQAGELHHQLYRSSVVQRIAGEHKCSVSQILLAFVTRSGHVIALPKASSISHVEENAAADAVTLTERDLTRLNEAFPPPTDKMPLDIQ